MANLIAVTFQDETAAFSLRAAIGKLQKEFLIDMEDVVVVTRDDTDEIDQLFFHFRGILLLRVTTRRRTGREAQAPLRSLVIVEDAGGDTADDLASRTFEVEIKDRRIRATRSLAPFCDPQNARILV